MWFRPLFLATFFRAFTIALCLLNQLWYENPKYGRWTRCNVIPNTRAVFTPPPHPALSPGHVPLADTANRLNRRKWKFKTHTHTHIHAQTMSHFVSQLFATIITVTAALAEAEEEAEAASARTTRSTTKNTTKRASKLFFICPPRGWSRTGERGEKCYLVGQCSRWCIESFGSLKRNILSLWKNEMNLVAAGRQRSLCLWHSPAGFQVPATSAVSALPLCPSPSPSRAHTDTTKAQQVVR